MESETEGRAQAVVATVTASAQMRAAREAAGLQLSEVAARTRVPLRHLEALERGDFAALPGITYCAGFARAYARAVGLDEKALVAKVRQEIDAAGDFAADAYQMDEPADPARVPPRSLAWVAAVAGLLMVSGYGIWRMQVNTPPGEQVVADTPADAPAGVVPARPVPPPVLIGPVVLTAVEDVWLRIYDADGKTILQKTLAKGESFTVPEAANNPMILTGRADALAVTVGGRAIPPLGTAERTISDVPISAQALLARGAGPAPVASGQQVPAATDGQLPAAPAQQGARPQGVATGAQTGQPSGRAAQSPAQTSRPQQASRPASSTEQRKATAPAAPAAPTAASNASGE